jgi:hypothetical protein
MSGEKRKDDVSPFHSAHSASISRHLLHSLVHTWHRRDPDSREKGCASVFVALVVRRHAL